jgi:hypothetical protein
MADAQLSPGWSLQQIRDVSGDHEAVALGPNLAVKWVARPGAVSDNVDNRVGVVKAAAHEAGQIGSAAGLVVTALMAVGGFVVEKV